MTKDISLKAACADTFHYPQEWDPSKGTLDRWQGKRGFEHHLGKQRVKNLHKGVLLIRFEMPFKVQCLRCRSYIAQGVRYDADKKKVGNYFSSPIYEFSMHCRAVVGHEKSVDGRVYCNQQFVIRTDPRNGDYELAEGLRRKVEAWDPADSEGISFTDPAIRSKMEADPMFRIEQTQRDAAKEARDKERARELEALQLDREDAYALNSVLRRANREKRKREAAEEEARLEAGLPNFCLPLQPHDPEDAREAAAVAFRTDHDRVEVAARRAAAGAAPLFARSAGGSSGAAGGRLQELVAKRRRLAEHARAARAPKRPPRPPARA